MVILIESLSTYEIFKSILIFTVFCSDVYTRYSNCSPIDPGGCPDFPIDSGVVMLIAAAVGIAVKKYYSGKKTGTPLQATIS